MQPPFPSPVSTWHNDTYSAISPGRAELSCTGKKIIITGAGSGIGRETAIAFANANAKRIILIGRTESTLTETRNQVMVSAPATSCSICRADVTDEEAIYAVAEEVGTWDVLVLNAGYLPEPAPITKTSIQEYWKTYETNVKSVVIATHAFLPTANKAHATVIGVSAGGICLPPSITPGLSSYMSSKTAAVKILEYLAAENPHLYVVNVQPGIIDTHLLQKSGLDTEKLPMDTVQLPAHFIVWLTSSEAALLHGKFVWANWDVEELQSLGSKLQGSVDLTIGLSGWPFVNPK